MSGYANEILAREGVQGQSTSFIGKQFTAAALRAAVRTALGQNELESPGGPDLNRSRAELTPEAD
jgi:hypothetical protein